VVSSYDLLIRNGLIYDGSGRLPTPKIVLAGFKTDRLKPLTGKTLADIVVFNPARIQNHATFEQPHQYATGVRDIFVNGVQVLRDGEHTGAKPGQVVRGLGWKKSPGKGGLK